MIQIFRKTVGLLVLLFLGLLILGFASYLQQFPQLPQGEPSYPAPNSAIEQTSSYPAPPLPTLMQNDLVRFEWLTYTDEEAGYSFTYKSNFLIFDGKNAGEVFNHISIFFGIGNESMRIAVLPNPEQLPLEEFLKTGYSYYVQPDELWKKAEFQEHVNLLTVSNQISVQIERSDTTFSITGKAKYAVFIPYEDRIIAAWLGPSGSVPSYEPSIEAADYFNQVITSIQFEQ